MNGMQGTDGNDTLTADGGSSVLYGQGGNDVMDGGDATDQLLGGHGDDTITGGGGHDQVDGDYAGGGGTGNDTIYLRDSHYDELFSCGGGTDSAQLDAGTTDVVTGSRLRDARPRVDRRGGGGGGGGDPSLKSIPPRPSPCPTSALQDVPDASRFVTLKTATKQLDGRRDQSRPVGSPALKRVSGPLRETVEDGDIVDQSPKAGTVLTAAWRAPYPRFDLTVYDEALDYKRHSAAPTELQEVQADAQRRSRAARSDSRRTT